MPTLPSLLTTLAMVALVACAEPGNSGEKPLGDPTPEIHSLLLHSAAAWNARDLDGFVSDYADDSTTTFMSGGGPHYGFDWIRRHYARGFEPGAVHDSLRFEDVAARPLGSEYALATARYVLFRADSITSSGPFTLVLRWIDGRWRIIHDHTSTDD